MHITIRATPPVFGSIFTNRYSSNITYTKRKDCVRVCCYMLCIIFFLDAVHVCQPAMERYLTLHSMLLHDVIPCIATKYNPHVLHDTHTPFLISMGCNVHKKHNTIYIYNILMDTAGLYSDKCDIVNHSVQA